MFIVDRVNVLIICIFKRLTWSLMKCVFALNSTLVNLSGCSGRTCSNVLVGHADTDEEETLPPSRPEDIIDVAGCLILLTKPDFHPCPTVPFSVFKLQFVLLVV